MRNFKVRLSLRYKLLFLLTTLPVVSLALYLLIATDLFKKDKVAYVFDSSAAVSHSLASQTRIEIEDVYARLRLIVEHYDFQQSKFNDVGQELFDKNPKVYALLLYRHQADNQYLKVAQLVKKDQPAALAFADDQKLLSTLREQALETGAFVSANPALSGGANFAFRLGELTDKDHLVIMALLKSDDMVNAFDGSGIYATMVMTRSGVLSIGDENAIGADLNVLRNVLKTKISEGTAETRMNDGQTYLISYANVGVGDMVVVSKVDKNKALKAVEVLIFKSLLFFIALIASTLVISVIASSSLTSTLRELFEATGFMAQGDFSVRVKPKSRDEVGGLAESFNYMAGELSRLMSETAEKARMESELSTVRTVQETLFPAAQCQFGPLSIRGHFEPANECGGDWWSYSRVGNRIFLWVGDATGHGAPAALITAAARSAAAVIELLAEISPGQALSIMNHAIHQTSKGQIMMTFFMACIDLEKNTFTYASASHDPPYFMKYTGEKLTKRDLLPLNEVNGPRLGDQKGFQYEDITIPFNPGDQIFLYTDGILDIQNKTGKKWGERAFLKTLVDSANNGLSADEKIEHLRRVVDNYREGSSLIDDVTMVLCEYSSQAQGKAAA